MILRLLQRDHAVHYAPYWLPMALVLGIFLSAVGRDGIQPGWDGDFFGPVMLTWVIMTMFLAFAQIFVRSTRFDMSLPVSPRLMWAVRVISVTATSLVILTASVLVTIPLNVRSGVPALPSSLLAFVVELMSVITLLVAMIGGIRPTANRMPVGTGPIVSAALAWTGCLLLLFALVALGPAWSVVPLAIAAALFARTWRLLSGPFSLPSDDAKSSRRDSPQPDSIDEGAAPGGSRGTTVTGVVFRTLYYHGLSVVMAVFLVFFGVYISGIYPDDLSGPVFLLMLGPMMPALVLWPLSRLFRLDHLPISRRRIFPFVVVPVPAIVCVSLAGALAFGHLVGAHQPLNEVAAMCAGERRCRFPVGYLEVAWDGTAPTAQAPWGEEHDAWSVRPIRGLSAAIYAPFSIPDGSSSRYAAWQISRGIRAVYGVDIDPARIDADYLSSDGEGRPLFDTAAALRDFPRLRTRGWVETLPVEVLLICVGWFLLAALAIQGYFASGWRRSFVVLARIMPAFTPLVLLVLLIWAGEFGYTSSWKLTAFADALLVRLAHSIPGGVPGSWVAAILATGVSYWVASYTFAHAEAPPRPSRELAAES